MFRREKKRPRKKKEKKAGKGRKDTEEFLGWSILVENHEHHCQSVSPSTLISTAELSSLLGEGITGRQTARPSSPPLDILTSVCSIGALVFRSTSALWATDGDSWWITEISFLPGDFK
ncbi:hypothetical protein AWENTII_013019 [Aspergillus wentii]